MSDEGPASGSGGFGGSGRPPVNGSGRKHLNGHSQSGHGTEGSKETKSTGAVVVPFPRKKNSLPKWVGVLLGWVSLLAFAGLVWGVSKDGHVDAIDVFAGLFGVLTALWFYRTREK